MTNRKKELKQTKDHWVARCMPGGIGESYGKSPWNGRILSPGVQCSVKIILRQYITASVLVTELIFCCCVHIYEENIPSLARTP